MMRHGRLHGYRAMDIELLKTFLEVNRTRHFGKAAANLFITQSTVSSRIRLLETALGAPLFTRTRNDMRLTPTGERLLRHADNIVTTWNRARQETAVEDDAGLLLTIAGMPSLWDIVLQDWLHRLFQSVYENQTGWLLHTEVLGPDSMTRKLLDGTLDLGFMFDPPQLTDLLWREVLRIPLVLVSSQAGLSLEHALRNGYVLVDWGTSFASAHAQHFPDIKAPAVRMGLGRIARDFLLHCGGSAYLAEAMVDGALTRGALHRVEDAPVIERTAYAVYSTQTEKAAGIEHALSLFASAPS